ncbi:polysaccharide biosynthesis protein [Mannheimia varigena]|uniref:polysaccharide biosynthesis protein n=1 Tax=Mannheimia varigena TaxID=85404 RepID=UPI0015B71025|nr:nucleoside-diphosphate sugar epimerase/dehydratase [Mannheimia varigena]QLD33739.1 polysaccharide biosynthesis protein [Mannheimia varigena]
MLDLLVDLPRVYKRAISIIVDILLITFAFYLSYWTRLGNIYSLNSIDAILVLFITIIVTLVAFIKLGLYRAVLRYMTFKALAVVMAGSFISAISLVVFSFFTETFIPRTVPLIYFCYIFILCGGIRALLRYLVGLALDKGNESVLIYGAGANGRQLAVMLRHSYRYRIKGFIDDNPKLQNSSMLGYKIYQNSEIRNLIDKYAIKVILLAIPSASRAERKNIIDDLLSLKIKVQTIPDMEDILQGKAKINELREVNVEDLLGRDPVQPNKFLFEKNIKEKVVMVTGAGGSIGSELCRQIIRNKPKKLILFELSEFSLYSIQMELNDIKSKLNLENTEIIPILGNVQSEERLIPIFNAFNIDTVYHAAAYKHVPLVEYNMIEGVKNNVFGTYSVAKLALEYKVKSFVLISTDKAVRPTNVMGATKRIAELSLQALAKLGSQTSFSMVRFGNVLGSSGSVIPLFKQQILKGGPITLTHPEIIRYFMTIPEAAQLVIQAGAMAKGGDVFILDMGEPVRILDLAKNLIQLSGLKLKDETNPTGDIEIIYTGLRPGEKLYEELLIGGDNIKSTAHQRIMTAEEVSLSFDEFSKVLNDLSSACQTGDCLSLREILLSAPTGFSPNSEIVDVVYKA